MKLHHALRKLQHKLLRSKQKNKRSGEESDGGDTELDYEDYEKAVVLPDKDEEANQTADHDIVKVDDHLQVTPGDINYEEVTNTQETTDEGIDDKKPTGPQDGTVSHFFYLGSICQIPFSNKMECKWHSYWD